MLDNTVNTEPMSTEEWNWRVDWCQRKGISPYLSENWNRSGEEYERRLNVSADVKECFEDMAIDLAKRGQFKTAASKLISIYGYENSHSVYTIDEWIEQVNLRVTRTDYWTWVAHQLVKEK